MTEEVVRVAVCPVSEALRFLEKPYTLQILHRLYNTSPLRFTQLQNLLEVSPKVLTSRLHELGELGIITRRSHDRIPPHVDYELSPKGVDLIHRIPVDLTTSRVTFPLQPGKMFDDLQSWAEKYGFVGLTQQKST